MPPPNLSPLFEPFALKSLSLDNRIVMAPMTRGFSPSGVPGADVAAYYARRARNGVGLIISEGAVVDRPAAQNEPDIPHFHGSDALAGWRSVIDAVHAEGGRMAPQLWHVGAAKHPRTEWTPPASPEGPSGLSGIGHPYGRPMTENDIADTVAAFARSAGDAKALGFDTVEIHAAHGYLIDQFFWDMTNTRSDRFGGATIRDRTRFAAELVRSLREAVGPSFPIIMRISQWKQQDMALQMARTPAALADWLTPLVDAGVDLFHCSQRRFWTSEFPDIDGPEGLNLAGWAKKLTGAATISVGSVGLSGDFLGSFSGESQSHASLERLIARMEREEFDLIAVGRALLNDPGWADKIKGARSDELLDFDPRAMSELV